MHQPPAVSYEVVRSPWLGGLYAAIWGVGLCVTLLFLWDARVEPAIDFALSIVLISTGLAAWYAWRSSAVGLLQWDGTAWYWAAFGDAPLRSLTMALDLQHLVMLRIQGSDGRSACVCLHAHFAPNWLALRRALVAGQQAHHWGANSGQSRETEAFRE